MPFFHFQRCSFFFLLIINALLFLTHSVNKSAASANDDNDKIGDSIRSDLKESKRTVFAAGMANDTYTLFISGLQGKSKFEDGYQVDVDHEPYNGVFAFGKVTPLSTYKDVNSSEVVFVVTDSSGGNLVFMSNTEVKVLRLGKAGGSPSPTKIAGYDVKNCYREGSLHFASYEPNSYYILEKENGRFSRMKFDEVSLNESTVCNTEFLGKMCISRENMTISKDCKDPPPPKIISGGSHLGAFYLFDSKNNIYYFPRYPIGDGKPYPYMKVKRDIAWSPVPRPPDYSDIFPPCTNWIESSESLLILIVVPIVVAVLGCSSGIVVYVVCIKRPAVRTAVKKVDGDKGFRKIEKSEENKKKETNDQKKKTTGESKKTTPQSKAKDLSSRGKSGKSSAAPKIDKSNKSKKSKKSNKSALVSES